MRRDCEKEICRIEAARACAPERLRGAPSHHEIHNPNNLVALVAARGALRAPRSRTRLDINLRCHQTDIFVFCWREKCTMAGKECEGSRRLNRGD